MSNLNASSLGAFVLRVSLGVMFLMHGFVLKFLTFGPAGTAKFFQSIGYPAEVAYIVIAAETLAGIALIAGFQVRLISVATLPILAGALLQHLPNGWVFSAQGGGYEYPLYLLLLAVVQAILGAGAFAVSSRDWLPAQLAASLR